MPKSLLLSVGLIGCSIVNVAAAQDDAAAAMLSDQQRAWLADHPVLRISHDPYYPPLEFDDNGAYRGISADYFTLLGERLGVRFEIVPAETWDRVLEMARDRDIDVVTLATSTEDRRAYLNFTTPYVSFPAVIIVRRDVPGDMTISSLKGKRVGAPSGYSQLERLRKNHPEIDVVSVATPRACLRQVSLGGLDACVLRLPVASHFISEGNRDEVRNGRGVPQRLARVGGDYGGRSKHDYARRTRRNI